MITSTPQNRSAARLALLVAEERVETNYLYMPADGQTHCNQFVAAVCSLMGAPLPPGLLANEQWTWLSGQVFGGAPSQWGLVDAHTAQNKADQGELVVASWRNPDASGHGHVAIGMPSLGESGTWIAAAGSRNFTRTLMQNSFGMHVPDWFVHP